MPKGKRPSIAALARSGARKASEIVMLTLRGLQPARSAANAELEELRFPRRGLGG